MLDRCVGIGGGVKSAWVVRIGLGLSALSPTLASECVRKGGIYSSGQASAAVGLKQPRFPTPCGLFGTSGVAQVLAEGGASRRKQFFFRLQPYVVLRKLACALFMMLLFFVTVPF